MVREIYQSNLIFRSLTITAYPPQSDGGYLIRLIGVFNSLMYFAKKIHVSCIIHVYCILFFYFGEKIQT